MKEEDGPAVSDHAGGAETPSPEPAVIPVEGPERGHLVAGGSSPWRAVVGFGIVSLAADMVYEGARSITGPLLASLGASAVLVGLVTGAGEAMSLVLPVVFGSWRNRGGRYWALTLAVLPVLTAVCLPALAIAPFLGEAGLVLACDTRDDQGAGHCTDLVESIVDPHPPERVDSLAGLVV